MFVIGLPKVVWALKTQMLTQCVTREVTNLQGAHLSLEGQAWFAVFTSSHHEKKVSQYLMQQQIENFLPLYSEIRHWTNRRKVELQLPLFPNYVFVRINRKQRSRVLGAPGVLSLVGCGYQPMPLPDSEIESLRSALRLRRFEPHPYLIVGDRVRLKTGVLDGMEGILLRRKSNLRVVLSVALIKQSVAVEVDAGDIEPVSTWQVARTSSDNDFQS
jgi:transcription antitermination factor NusG